MAKPEPRARTVLEPLSHFNLSEQSRAPVRSLAISNVSDSECLIYLGTQFGGLFLFSLDPKDLNAASASEPSSSPSVLQNIKFVRNILVGNSSVDYIHVFGEIGKVLVLLEGFLFLVDSLLLQPLKKLSFLRGISVITRRLRSSESECSNLSEGAGSSSEYTSTSQRFLKKLGGGIRANGLKVKEAMQHRVGNHVFSVLIGKRLILLEFVLSNRIGKSDQDVDDGSFVILKEIQCIDGVMAMVWLNDSIIVSTLSGYTLFSCVTGQSGVIFSLPDVSSPPRLKLLCKEWNVLLLVDNVGIIANAHGQPVGGSLVFHRDPDSIGEISSYVVVAKDGKMELYHKKTGRCVQMVTFGGEGVGGPCIVADEEDGSGKLIVVATPTKVICYRKLSAEEQIKDLLRKKNFKEAISLVEELECEGELSKDMLSFVHAQVGFLLLFDLHFEEAVHHFLQSETMQPSEVFPFIMRDPNRWSLLVPRNRYWGLHPPPAPLEDVVDDGLMAIQRAIFLRKAGVETVVDDAFLLKLPSRDDLLESAIKSITRYLEVSRDKELTPSVKEGVDTLLMYLYRALNNVNEMEKLVSSANSCVVEELESLLDDSGHLRTLAFLYSSKGMSSKALAIWRILARNYSSGLWKDHSSESSSHSVGTNILSGKETAAAEASKILEESSDSQLVLQHLGWVAEINQVFAVQILTSEKRDNQLPPEEVIAAIDPKKVEILQRYLQWLIEDQDSDDTQFHTIYALSLAKSAIESFEAEINSRILDPARREETGISECSTSAIFQSPVRERLQIFLLSSDLYDPEEVLDLIEGSELWSEKAILYKNQDREGGFETIQEFQDRDEAIRHWETQQKYDTDFFVHPERFLICRDKHVIIFPIIITDFNGCWVKIHAKGGSDAHSQVTYQDMWTIFKKIGRNIKYLSSEAKAQRPHGNLLKGTGITPDLQALFLNLGADDTDPMLYKKDVKDLHQLLSSFKLKKVTTAKLTKEQQIITDCVDRWISFLSDTCLQDPVPKKWTIVSGTAIDPPYLNHDHVRLIFNYPASWSSTEELRFLANMYKLCLENNQKTNLVTNKEFENNLIECNYNNWDDCFFGCKKNTSPLLNDVYHFGKGKFYLDHTGKLIINSFVLFAYNCIKHYDRIAQKSHTQEEILAELHKQFPNFTEVIYQAFYKAVAKGYKHPVFSIEQILTERI